MPLLNPQHAYQEYVPTLDSGERFEQHHLKVRRADLSRYVLIPGSHLRGRLIAESMDECRVVSATRGYYVYTGLWGGQRMTVCSTGIGGPAAAIAMEELGALGCDTFIRVGSAGGLAQNLGVGDVVIASAAVRGGGASQGQLPSAVPAVADVALTTALQDAAKTHGVPVNVGVCASSDLFYDPEGETRLAAWARHGVLAIEMEADTLFAVGMRHGWRVAAALVLDGGKAKDVGESSCVSMEIANHAVHPMFKQGEAALIRISLTALRAVATQDDARTPPVG